MAQHFLACPHLDSQQVWKDLHHTIQKYSIRNNISSTLYSLIEYRLHQGQLTQPPFSPTETPLTQQMSQAQTQMGWQQMYYGRCSPQWIKMCTSLHSTTNSTHYFAKIITLTWQAAIAIWTLQNKHLHPSNPTEADCMQLQVTVQQIFHNVPQEPHLHIALQSTTPDQIMTKTTWQTCQWVSNCHNHISNQCKAAKIRAKLCNTDIQQYFPKNTHPNQVQQTKTSLGHPKE